MSGEAGPGVSDAAIGMIPIIGQVYSGFQNFQNVVGGVADWLTQKTTPALEDARTHGLEPLEDASEDAAGAQDELKDRLFDVTGALREQFDLIDGKLDAFGSLIEATQEQVTITVLR